MQRIDIDDVDPIGMADADRRGLTDPLGTSDLAINHYALDPGEVFTGGMHTHLDQEEVFYVVDGTATFEFKAEATGDSETVEVGPGEAVRFPPGEYQQGRNDSEDRVVALALGAPKESSEVRLPRPCPECDSDVVAYVMDEDGPGLECPECGTDVEM